MHSLAARRYQPSRDACVALRSRRLSGLDARYEQITSQLRDVLARLDTVLAQNGELVAHHRDLYGLDVLDVTPAAFADQR